MVIPTLEMTKTSPRLTKQQLLNQLSAPVHPNFSKEDVRMTTTESISTNIAIVEFAPKKQLPFFEGLRKICFSGQLLLESPVGQKWTFYLYLGRILYATGGTHPVRRWKRNVTVHCPQIGSEEIQSLRHLPSSTVDALQFCWEYQALCTWVEQQKISREQASHAVWSIVTEVLFDVTQANEITFLLEQGNPPTTSLILLNAERLISEVQQKWQLWQQAKIADRLPNRAPIIHQPKQMQQQVSASTYQTLTALLNGKRTLRDLAIATKRDVAEMTRSLLPYIQAGLVKLVDIPDLSAPIASSPIVNSPAAVPPVPIAPATPAEPEPEKPLIACVDDSPAVCRAMETILTKSGYRFVAIQDSLRAITTLLTRKPDLIFLDLVMPNTNGYEICSQLRKVALFRNTPIIILTGNDGIVDRVRAKVVGASDFLGKPVDAKTVVTIAQKHLKHLQEDSVVVG